VPTYTPPLAGNPTISQNFGDNPGGYNPPGGHNGRDYAVPEGTSIFAVADGVIDYEGWTAGPYDQNPWWFLPGDMVIVLDTRTDNILSTNPTFVYGHLSQTFINQGDKVVQGQRIGLTGNTGRSTGPHLHFEALPAGFDLNNGMYGRVDPGPYLDQISVTTESVTPATPVTPDTNRTDEDSMKIIATNGSDGKVWIGDYLFRRHIGTMDTKQGIDYLAGIGAGPLYKNGEIQTVPDLDVIGIDVMALAGKNVNGQ
jgi:hypothetical protein